jgi:transposase-like protein
MTTLTRILRAIVRVITCPYCGSTDVDEQLGWCECRDCGKSFSV